MNRRRIYVLSDSLGVTAEHVSKAAASQFPKDDFEIVRLPKIKTKNQIDQAMERIHKDNSVIFYTLVELELREHLEEEAGKYSIPKVDILGPALNALEIISENPPHLKPGVWRQLNRSYFRKIEALEFAVKSDDGRNARALKDAEIVLIGVSRTSKTPLSMYMAYRGWKVANVPIVHNIEPPEELFRIPPEKIVGLTIDPETLLEIRGQRLEAIMGKKETGYARLSEIMKELKYAESIMKKLKCRRVNVAHKAIEETANEILRYFA
jgi:regulator of PEP synthase PpsR (kinase-PPPase family)